MRPRTAFAALVVAGGALLGGWFATHVAGWVEAPWVNGGALEPLEPWSGARDLRGAFETFPAPGGRPPRLRLLDENVDAWVERWRLLAAARERVDVASFIVRDDVFGLSFFGHLLHLRRQGVQVRLLVDAHGTKMARSPFEEDYLDELVNTGVAVRVYRPMTARIAQAVLTLDPIAAIASEHDKLLLVDRRLSLVGGRNIAHEYFADPARSADAFRDVDVTIEGKATCRALERAFDVEWDAEATHALEAEDVDLTSHGAELLGAYRAMDAWLRGDPGVDGLLGLADDAAGRWLQVLRNDHPELRGALTSARPRGDRAEVRLLDSAPRRPSADDQVTEGLRRLLAAARDEVLIQSPYLVLSEAAVQLLADAAARGVEITVLTNSASSSDNAVSQAFFLEQWPEVLARVRGMRLFVRGDGHNLHGKTAVFDGQVAVVSTYNLDPISIYVDGEVAVVAWSQDFAGRVAAPIRAAIEDDPATLEYRIARAPDGTPRRGPDGAPIVEFGPRDHTDPERWTALSAWWRLLRTMKDVAGFDPIF